MIIVGIVYLVASTSDHRTPRIIAFNSAMEDSGFYPSANGAATGGLMDDFKTLRVSATLNWGSSTQKSKSMTLIGKSTTLDVSTSASEVGKTSVDSRFVNDYAFETSSTFTLSTACDWDTLDGPGCEPSDTMGISLILNGDASNALSVPVNFLVEKKTGDKSFETCHRPNGWNDYSQQCYKYEYVNELCVKVHNTGTAASPQWALDGVSTPAGQTTYGCGYASGWSPRSSTNRLQAYSSSSIVAPLSFTMTLLASEGPTVNFYKIMGPGARSFGNTQEEDFVTGISLLSVGSVWSCVICSALILISLLFIATLKRICTRVLGRNRGYTQQWTTTATTTSSYVAPSAAVYQQPKQVPIAYAAPVVMEPPVAYATPM
jgi:hypothetical protein